MKFYLCQTKDGPRYARTQADAKALDPKFELVDYATDQAGLVERFNALMASAPAASPPVEETTSDFDEAEEPEEAPQKVKRGKATPAGLDWQSAPEAGSCKRCIAMSEAARHIEGIMAATNIQHTLFSADARLLDRVQEAIDDRRRELVA